MSIINGINFGDLSLVKLGSTGLQVYASTGVTRPYFEVIQDNVVPELWWPECLIHTVPPHVVVCQGNVDTALYLSKKQDAIPVIEELSKTLKWVGLYACARYILSASKGESIRFKSLDEFYNNVDDSVLRELDFKR